MGRTNCSICRHSDRAAIDIAMLAGESDSAIARKWGLTQTAATIHRAKHLVTSPANMSPARREEHDAALAKFALSKKAARVGELEKLYQRITRVMDARSAEYTHLPGGDSGLIGLKLRSIGTGENAQVVEDAVFDSALAQQAREVLKAIAGEMGEWDITGAGARAANDSGATSITVIQAVSGPGETRQVIAADARPGAAKPLPALESPRPQGLISALNDAFKQHSITSEAIDCVSVPVADGPGEGASDGVEGGE